MSRTSVDDAYRNDFCQFAPHSAYTHTPSDDDKSSRDHRSLSSLKIIFASPSKAQTAAASSVLRIIVIIISWFTDRAAKTKTWQFVH
jgi:hypothetical protein